MKCFVFVGAQYGQRKRQALSYICKYADVLSVKQKIVSSAHKHSLENHEQGTFDSYKILIVRKMNSFGTNAVGYAGFKFCHFSLGVYLMFTQ